MRVELSNLSASGTVSFKLEGDNRIPIEVQTNVVQNDLTNLVNAINDQSSRTGITAELSSNKKRIILVKADGKDIFISDYLSTSPQLNAKPIDAKGHGAAASVLLGGDNAPVDHARFSGLVELDPANSFSLTTEEGVTSNSVADTTRNGLVEITPNGSSDKKTIQFIVNDEADRNEASFDGQRAVVAAGRYSLNLPTSDDNITFSAEVSSGSSDVMTKAGIQRELVDKLRQQAPLASLSGGDAVAKPQSLVYTFSGPTVIDPSADTMNLTVAGQTLTVNMANGDGLGNAVTTAPAIK